MTGSPSKASNFVTDAREKIEELQRIAAEQTLLTVSIRVVSPLTIKYQWEGSSKAGQFVSTFAPEFESQCFLHYKVTQSGEAVNTVFPFNEKNHGLVTELVKSLSTGQYSLVAESPASAPYVWFFRGSLYNSYKELDALFFQALATGTLKLEKKDFANPGEWYSLSFAAGTRCYRSYYLFHDWQFSAKKPGEKALQKPSRSLTDCVICLDSKAEFLLNPCGHICLCGACSELLTAKKVPKKNRLCPICRQVIISSIRIFFA